MADVIKEKITALVNDGISKVREITDKSSNAVNNVLAVMSKILSEIIDAVGVITNAITVVNIVQTVAEIATAGIGAVVTCILIPLVAAVVINEAMPQIIKSLSGMKAEFSFAPLTINDVISIVTGGFGGLLGVILPRIFGISLMVSLVKYLKEYLPALSSVIATVCGLSIHPLFMIYLLIQNLMLFIFHKNLEDILKSKERADYEYSLFLKDYTNAVSEDDLDSVHSESLPSRSHRIFIDYPMGPQSGDLDNVTLFKLYYLGYEAMFSSMLQLTALAGALYLLSRRGEAGIGLSGAKRAIPFIIAPFIGGLGELFILRHAAESARIKASALDRKDIVQINGIGEQLTFAGLLFGITASAILSFDKMVGKKKLIDDTKTLRDNTKGNLFYRMYKGVKALTAKLRSAIFNRVYTILKMDMYASAAFFLFYTLTRLQKIIGFDTSPIANVTQSGTVTVEDCILNLYLKQAGPIEFVIGLVASVEAMWEGLSKITKAGGKAANIINKILQAVKKKIHGVYNASEDNKGKEYEKRVKEESEKIAGGRLRYVDIVVKSAAALYFLIYLLSPSVILRKDADDFTKFVASKFLPSVLIASDIILTMKIEGWKITPIGIFKLVLLSSLLMKVLMYQNIFNIRSILA